MARDFNKAIQDGQKLAENRSGLDISAAEVMALYDSFKADNAAMNTNDAILNLIQRAYNAGLAIGNRNA